MARNDRRPSDLHKGRPPHRIQPLPHEQAKNEAVRVEACWKVGCTSEPPCRIHPKPDWLVKT